MREQSWGLKGKFKQATALPSPLPVVRDCLYFPYEEHTMQCPCENRLFPDHILCTCLGTFRPVSPWTRHTSPCRSHGCYRRNTHTHVTRPHPRGPCIERDVDTNRPAALRDRGSGRAVPVLSARPALYLPNQLNFTQMSRRFENRRMRKEGESNGGSVSLSPVMTGFCVAAAATQETFLSAAVLLCGCGVFHGTRSSVPCVSAQTSELGAMWTLPWTLPGSASGRSAIHDENGPQIHFYLSR